MRLSNPFSLLPALLAAVRRIAAAAATTTLIAISAIAATAHAANIYGPPGLQPNKIGAGNPFSYAAVSADFNNDGYADLAVINPETNDLVIYTGNAIGTLTLSHDYGIFNFNSPSGIVAADVNGDGKIDLVITDYIGVSVLLGVGDLTASFTAANPQRPPTNDAGHGVFGGGSLAVADINHDGKPDIVVAGFEPGGFGGTYYYEVLLGTGGGQFVLSQQYTVSDNGSATRLADLDDDGQLDLVFVASGSVAWMKGVGNGQFLPATPLLTVNIGVGSVEKIEIIDVDGDGKVDVLMSNANGNGVWMAKGIGNGSFLLPTHLYDTGINVNYERDVGQIIVADVNGDGRLDIVADGYVLLQQANHSFVFNEHIGYSQTQMLAAIDLNHDGRADVVTAGPGTGTIAVFKTVGAGAANGVLPTGSPQSTVFNTAFAKPLSIKVFDSASVPVPNVLVIFSQVTPGGIANANPFSASTNAQGVVSYTPVANGGLGCYR